MAEARATKSDSEDSTDWRSMTPEEIANHVKGVGCKRRVTANSTAAGRTGEEADNDSVGDAGCQTACAEEEVIRTGAFVADDSQKELDFPDESLMSPTAQTQTLREDGGSSHAEAAGLGSGTHRKRGRRHLQGVGVNRTHILKQVFVNLPLQTWHCICKILFIKHPFVHTVLGE